MNNFKKIIGVISLSFVILQGMAQSTINPDSVCFGSTSETYWITNNPNSTYQWNIDPSTGGIITSGQGTSSIDIDWSATSIGLHNAAITLIETDNATGCSDQISLDVEILPLPTATIGTDVTACEGGLIQDLFAIGAQVTWYSDPGLINQVGTGNYYSTGQISPGTYTYYATETLNGCEGPSIPITLTILSSPTVDAGPDNSICQGDIYTLNGSGTNNNGYVWSTSGDGTFSNINAANPLYTPGVNDIANGTVILTLTALGTAPCGDISDDIVLTITPAATANAGIDASICDGDTYVLAALATNYSLVTWSSSGDGTFSNVNIVNPVYTPGVNDIANGTLDLTIVASGNGTCADAIDIMTITINSLPNPGPIQHN